MTPKDKQLLLEKAGKLILQGLSLDQDDENFHRTPERLSQVLQHYYSGIGKLEKVKKDLSVTFPSNYNDQVILTNLVGATLCPHHFLPIEYRANFAYMPYKRVVGASKPYLAFKTLAAQPILQEEFTEAFIETFWNVVRPKGCIVEIEGDFTCFQKDGINHHASKAKTLATRGVYSNEPEKVTLFLKLSQ